MITDFSMPADPMARRCHLAQKKRIMALLEQKLSPPRDRAVFWSGALWPATEYSIRCGKATLEIGLKRAQIDIPLDSPYTYELWCYASKLWADRSKGKTEAVLGHIRPASIYNTVELPALATNRKVTRHVEYFSKDILCRIKPKNQRRKA
ncbi:hypothetical protein CPB83DRAFT_844889 [Crepidotus variabilis]|uniref:Uncharacterized protein n=1 Tax=Crepidotus variabilis TaxID=179855 RepID=A0A9P6ESR4_9AGAR|nr:hypothetical protein CPB83DRAFT_844889 [Crepidotus variabilis]